MLLIFCRQIALNKVIHERNKFNSAESLLLQKNTSNLTFFLSNIIFSHFKRRHGVLYKPHKTLLKILHLSKSQLWRKPENWNYFDWFSSFHTWWTKIKMWGKSLTKNLLLFYSTSSLNRSLKHVLVALFLSGRYTLLTKILALARMTVSWLHNSFGQLNWPYLWKSKLSELIQYLPSIPWTDLINSRRMKGCVNLEITSWLKIFIKQLTDLSFCLKWHAFHYHIET